MGAQAHLWDVSQLTLPAGPPSRLRFSARPAEGCTPHVHDRDRSRLPVTARRRVRGEGGRQGSRAGRLLEAPRSHQPSRAPGLRARGSRLQERSGPVELVFETRGFETSNDPQSAPSGAPRRSGRRSHEAPLAILYLVDTLRADHTGPYGYARPTTPELDRFAKDAVVFETAVAHASWTKPSVASILTSLLPGQHRAVQLRDPLESSHALVSEMLHAKGFSTGAAIANSVIYLPESNFDRGFDYFAGLHGEEGRPSKLVDAAGGGRHGPALARLAPGHAQLPLRPHHGSARPLRAAAALRSDVRAPPHPGAPRHGPAQRLQGAARPRAR